MKKTSTFVFLKHLLFFLTILFCSKLTFAQAVNQRNGEFIKLTKTYPDPSKGDPEIIQGEMVIFGNSILGFMANDNASPNGDFNSEVSSSSQRRGYIDIDSDPNRDTNYQVGGVPIFNPLLSSNETDYNGIPGTLSADGSTLSNGQPILDTFRAPNYGQWLDGSASLPGPFLPGVEEGTFSSSSAELKINSTNEDCSRIQRAYLYWSGLYSGEQFIFEGSGGNRNFQRVRRERPDCIDPNGNPCELYTDIRILPPNATEYIDIKFIPDTSDGHGLKTEILYDDTWSRFLGYSHSVYNKQSTVYPSVGFNNMNQDAGWDSHPSYACRADITSLMNDLENAGDPVEGFWTVANIRSTVGRKGWGLGAGWSIVLVYEDPNADQKYITFFDGYVNVTSNSTSTDIDGFTTIPDGDVNVEFASVSLEGDIQLYGDNFRMNGTNIAAVKPAGVTSDIGYDSNNYMDSSIISIDRSPAGLTNLRRFPNSINNMGYDSDHFILNNLNNSIIDNGDSSANVIVDTGTQSNDQSSTYFTAFSVEVIAPNIQIFKEALDADGNVITSNQVRDLGDAITYRMTLTNIGNGEAINTFFRDIIPINTVFNPATANFSISPPLPAGFDFTYDTNYDSGEIDINGDPILTTRVSIEIPDSLDTANGQGFLEPDDEVVIEFTVNVVSDCRLLRNACDGQINNQADAEYSTVFDSGAIIPVQSAFDKDDCNLLIEGPTLSLADQAACSGSPIVEVLCIDDPLEIRAGAGFDIYEWYFDNPAGSPSEIGVFDTNDIPFPTDAEGNPTLNQQVISVLNSGFYHVYQELSGTDCMRINLTYQLQGLDFFNTNIDPYANAPTQNQLVCPDTNSVEVTEILICGLTDTVTLGSTEYPAGTSIAWQKLDENGNCTQTNELCSFPDINSSGGACFLPSFSSNNTETFDFNDEGVYRLTVILNGGCPFEYNFNIISFGVSPTINVASGGECTNSDVVLELSGVDLDTSGNLDGYTVDFVTLDTSDNIVSTLANDSTTPNITIPASLGNVRVQAIVTSDNPGANSCNYESNIEPITFFNLAIDDVSITREPSCFEDRVSTTTFDDSKGDVRIDLTGDSSPFYFYYLRNISDNSISQISGQQGTDFFVFEDVDPGNYIIEAFSSSNTITTSNPIPNCTVISDPFEIIEIPGYRAVVSTEQLSCNPAQITVTVEPLDPSSPIDFSDVLVRFTDPNDTSNTSTFSYSPDGSTPIVFEVDDSSVIIITTDENGDPQRTDSGADMFIDNLYTDESGSNPLDNNIQIDVFNSSCPLDIPNAVINPFDILELTIDPTNTRNPSCSGADDGRIAIIASGDNLTGISGYEIIDALPAANATYIGNTSATGVFTNLPDGTYTIQATQAVGTDTCIASIEHTIMAPDPITVPVIEIAQDYTCTPTEGHINITNTITGGNPFTTTPGIGDFIYRLLKYTNETSFITDRDDDNLLNSAIDTRQITNIANLPYESLTDGYYVLQIEDSLGCAALSNGVSIAPLSTVTIALDANPLLQCGSTTTTVEVSATATNGGVIEGYSISFSDNALISYPSAYQASGSFDLPVGNYEITARTENTLCESLPLSLEVLPLAEIAANKTGGKEIVTCVGDSDGSARYTINSIGADGYSYTLTSGGSNVTPSASSPQPGVNLITTNLLLEGLSARTYELTLTDTYTTCTEVLNFTIGSPTLAVAAIDVAPQYNCDSDIGTYSFTISASGGESSQYTFTYAAQTNNDGIFTVDALATTQTFDVEVEDGNGCSGTPVEVTLPAISDFQLTNNTISQCLSAGDVVSVPFTGGVAPILYKLDGATSFTSATVGSGTFDIDTNITTAGTFNYLIVDDNNSASDSCARSLSITFYDDISVNNISAPIVNCSVPAGAVPTSGATISFDIEGGQTNYTFTYETILEAETVITPTSGTNTSPTFEFDSSYDDVEITINIIDPSGCASPYQVLFTPEYPEVPVIDTIDIPTFVCDGETREVEITPNFETGETVNSFTYIFDGVEQSSNTKQYTEGTTSFTYAIKRISTGCITSITNGTFNSVAPITIGTIVTTPEECMPPVDGTATITINNGSGVFDVTVTNLEDTSLAPYFLDDTSSPATFPSLEIGNYSLTVTDSNTGCILTDYVEFRIIPEPNVEFDNEKIVANCTDRVTYFVEIKDGVGPFLLGLSLPTVIDPSLFGDNISNFNDPDFPTALFNTQSPAELALYSDLNRVYAYTRLEFDQSYTVYVQDTNTSCFSSAEVDPEPSIALNITLGTPINTGACALNTGEIPFSFDLIDFTELGNDYIAEIINVDGSVNTAITPVTIPNVVTSGNTGSITGLPQGSHILRIRPANLANECSGTTNFLIGIEPAMGPLEIDFSKGATCIDAAQLTLKVTGNQGRTPHEYLLLPRGASAPDDSTIFTESATISEATILSFTDNTTSIFSADAYVRDASGCINGPLEIDIDPLVEPTLSLDPFSPEDCEPNGLYTIGYSIGNFSATDVYTFTVNGNTPANAQMTFTVPDAAGNGTVSAQNRDTYAISITASSNPDCPANATFDLAEDVIQISATLGEPDCDNNISSITLTVNDGGYEGIATRSLIYEVFEGADVASGTLIASFTPSPLETDYTFNSGTIYGTGTALDLTANTAYSVRVTDIFDVSDGTRRCDDLVENISKSEISLPQPVTYTTTDLTCSTANDGRIELGVTGLAVNPNYSLYEFATEADALAAISAENVTSSVEISSDATFTAGNIFTGLKGELTAVYVAVVTVTSLSCPIVSDVIEIAEPDNTLLTNFVIGGENGNCDNTDLVTDLLPRITIDISGTLPSNLSDYEINISPSLDAIPNPLTFSDLTSVSATSYYIDANSIASETYTISITDTTTTCDALEYFQTVTCDTEIDPLTIAITSPAIDCFDITAVSPVTFEVTPANGNPLLFSYELTERNETAILDSGNNITTSPITIPGGLTAGDYVLSVTDSNETRLPPVIREFSVTMPDDLPDFTIAPITRTNCDTVEIEVNPITGSGTPGISPEYTLSISGGALPPATVMTEVSPGVFSTSVTPPSSGADTYTIQITDGNSCTNSKTIDVLPQLQIAATVNATSLCLNNGDAIGTISITSGTPPFSYTRTETGSGTEVTNTISQTVLPIDFEDTIDTAGSYDYLITDSFGCTTTSSITINSALTLTVTPNPASTACDASNMALSSSYDLVVTGGTGAGTYTYEVAIGEAAINSDTFTTYTGPNYTVNPSQEGERFVFRVSDTNNCPITAEPALITFPTFPEATHRDIVDIECPSGVGSLGQATITATPGTGKAPYSLFVVPQGGDFTTATALTGDPAAGIDFTSATEGVFEYLVEDANGCQSAIGTFAISNSSIILKNFNIEDITCKNAVVINNSGSIEVSVSNAEHPIVFNLFNLNNPSALLDTHTENDITIDGHEFTGLFSGDYRIEVTDSNNCTEAFIFEGRVNTNSDIIIGDYTLADKDCTPGGTGITILFPADGTGLIEIQHPIDTAAGFVDPITTGDRVFKYDDTDVFPGQATPVGVAPDKYYAISGLATDTEYTVVVRDATGCQEERTFRTPAADEITNVVTTTVNESICNGIENTDGQIIVNFDVGTSLSGSFEAYLYDELETNPELDNVTATALSATSFEATFSNLDGNTNYIVRIVESGQSPLCGNPNEIRVNKADEILAPSLEFGTANCSNSFIVDITATTSAGITPYEYAIVQGSHPASPVGTVFNSSPNLTANTSTGTNLTWTVFVRDAASPSCEKFTVANITREEEPDLDIDPEFSVDQCEDAVASYTITTVLNNYSASLAPYTFTVNGTTDNTVTAGNTVTFEVDNRGFYTIEVSDKNGCTDSDTITIYDKLDVNATLGSVNCDGNVESVEVNTTGGYIEPGRALTYELVRVNDLFVVANSGSIPTATHTFSGLTLDADTDYVVNVTDAFSTATICAASSENLQFEAIEKASFRTSVTNATCNGSDNGQVLVEELTLGDNPTSYALYQFATLFDRDNAVTLSNPTAGSTIAPSTSNNLLFEGLTTVANGGFYAVFVANGNNPCYTGEVIEITEPALFTGAGFGANPLQPGCDPIQDPKIEITTPALPDGEAPFYYRIPGLVETFTEITASLGTSFEVPAIANPGTTYNVEFTDASGTTCVTLPTIPVTFSLFTKNPNLDISATTSDYSCTTDEIFTLGITNRLGTENYTITNSMAIDFDGNPIATVTGTSTSDISYDFVITTPGRYEFEAESSLGCISNVFEHIVEDIVPLRIEASGNTVACFNDTAGISFEVLDYVGDYTYTYSFEDTTGATITSAPSAIINTSAGTQTISGLGINTYTVNVTAGTSGSTSCTNMALAQITGPNEDIAFLGTDELNLVPTIALTCTTDAATIITPAITGGTLPYTYTLIAADGSTASILPNETGVFDITVTATNYTVEITDDNNCTVLVSAVKTVEPLIDPIVSAIPTQNIRCFGDSITFSVNVTNATDPAFVAQGGELTYALFHGNGIGGKGDQVTPANTINEFTVNYSEFGYVVEVTDGIACPVTTGVTVTQPEQLTLNVTPTTPMSCDNPTTAEYTITTNNGGTAGYTFEVTEIRDFRGDNIALSTIPSTTNNTGIFLLNQNTVNFISVTDFNGCDPVTTSITVGDGIKEIEFDIEFTTTPLCNGDTNAFVQVADNFVSGGEGNYTYAIINNFGSTLASSTVNDFFGNLGAGNYVYQITSGSGANGCTARIPFEIIELPEIALDVEEVSSVSCEFEDDGEIRLKVENDLFNAFPSITSFTYEINSSDSSFSLGETVSNDDDEAVFSDLAPDIYTYRVFINGSSACLIEGTLTVLDKESLLVSEINSIPASCKGDEDGEKVYAIIGGGIVGQTSDYYYVLQEDDSTEPDGTTIVGNPTFLLDPLANGILELTNLKADVVYSLFVYDSGNGQTGENLKVCAPWEITFEFPTEDLDAFTAEASPNCNNLNYTISVSNNNPELDETNLRINVYDRSTGALVVTGNTGLMPVDVPSGTYDVGISNINTGCESTIRYNLLEELEPFSKVEFVEMDENGDPLYPFAATNEINVYQLQVTGGVEPNAIDAYVFSGMLTKMNGEVVTIEIDSEGRFEVEDSGEYVFTVFDNYGDFNGNTSDLLTTCKDITSSIAITHIDIDVPNVFNPSSGLASTNLWYPDNLTSSFNGVSPVVLDNDDANVPRLPGVTSTTGGTVIGGTTTGGTTTNGVTVGGSVSGGTGGTVVTGNIIGGYTTTSVTTGAITENGVTSGGITITTTSMGSGSSTVTVTIGGVITGGTLTNGVITGGVVSGGTTQTLTGNMSGGETVYNITTGGTTTGGTTNGGSTVGGTTSNGVTTGGTTNGASIINGTTAGGTTITIVENASGTTVTLTNNTTVTGGNTTNGVTTGGTTTGGTIVGGTESLNAIEFIDYANIEVLVFDRYGRLLADFKGVEEDTNNNQGWDGTYQGKDMPSGDYWYIIKLNDDQGREFTGHFTLYRR